MSDQGILFETSRFNDAIREMKRYIGGRVSMERIVDFETSKILEASLRRTKTATVGGIRASADSRQWTTLNGKKYKLSNRYSTSLHRQITEKRRASLNRKLAARGLSRQTWHAIGRKMGFDIAAPGYVRSAKTPKHTNDENVATSQQARNGVYGRVIENHSPLIRWSEARQAFYAAVVGRRKFFSQNLKRGVFFGIKDVMKKYPGMVVTV